MTTIVRALTGYCGRGGLGVMFPLAACSTVFLQDSTVPKTMVFGASALYVAAACSYVHENLQLLGRHALPTAITISGTFVILHGPPVPVHDFIVWSPILTYIGLLSAVYISPEIGHFLRTIMGSRDQIRIPDVEQQLLPQPQEIIERPLDTFQVPEIINLHLDGYQDYAEVQEGPIRPQRDQRDSRTTELPTQLDTESETSQTVHHRPPSSPGEDTIGFNIDHMHTPSIRYQPRTEDQEADDQSISLSSTSHETTPSIRRLITSIECDSTHMPDTY